ncbi:cytochrome b [Pacificimonas sp. WHA3]|uniref:Cytochrome b n=1 Tax=Pacificimonas pallii TaxID=2827236 RepID=A0ABS6SDT3_9SPHN|nr:cytochrome b [Pacificimonas pallii]MBV7256510.1 cytochrome b [Pacificimonas pallii]
MSEKSSTARSSYSRGAIWLHWIIALVIIGQFLGMQYDETLAETDPARGTIYMLHKSFGLTILFLTLVRLIIRLRQGFLPLPPHMAGWEVMLARVTHFGFYALLLLMPLTGWIFGVSAKRGLDYFGLVPVPVLPLEGLAELAHELHEYGAWAFVILFILHVAGALKHHYLDRDDVATRMIPMLKRRS